MDANGISIFEKQKLKFSRLAHERNERYGGEFYRAKAIYKELLSVEGHRHYPLREPKCLRLSPDLMLPLGLFLVFYISLLCLCVNNLFLLLIFVLFLHFYFVFSDFLYYSFLVLFVLFVHLLY